MLGVGLPGGQAVVEHAQQPVEQVALGGGVPVSGRAAAVIVGAGAKRGPERGERPEIAHGGQPLVLILRTMTARA
jgi:hypothetical protein